eukprot:g2887.t1
MSLFKDFYKQHKHWSEEQVLSRRSESAFQNHWQAVWYQAVGHGFSSRRNRFEFRQNEESQCRRTVLNKRPIASLLV